VGAPAGGVVSNVADLCSWLRLYLGRGEVDGVRLLSAELVEEMLSPQVSHRYVPGAPDGPLECYGLGWTIRPYRGRYLVHHGGWIDGYVSWVSMMPEEGIGVVVLSNRGGQLLPYFLNYHVYHRLLGLGEDWSLSIAPDRDAEEEDAAAPGEREDAPPTHPLDDFVGSFAHLAYGTIAVALEGDALRLTFNEKVTVALEHLRHNTFVARHENPDFDGLRVSFPLHWSGHLDTVEIPLQADVEDIVFRRLADDSLRNEAYLRAFAGTYVYEGMPVSVQLRGGTHLVALVPGEPEQVLEPFAPLVFTFRDKERWTLEFHQDEAGKVVRAVVNRPEGSIPCVRRD
jgi:hypothetical protein